MRRGRRKRATSRCKLKWLRGLATTIVCSFGSSYLRPQNRYFTPNCICRGIELPVLEMLPNPVLPKLKSGNPKLGVLVTLYTSARSCNLRVPLIDRSLKIDMSKRRCGGPCISDNPTLPDVNCGAAEKTLVSNHRSTVR